MAFLEIRFPTNISFGSRGGPGFNTAIIEADSGVEERVSRWENPRHRYQAGYGARRLDDLESVLRFYRIVKGPAYGFRYKDPLDYATTSDGRTTEWGGASDVSYDNVVLGTGDGTETDFQLIKRYTEDIYTRVRTLQKPVEGSVRVAIDGAEQSTGWSCDPSTGVVIFTSAPSAGEVVTAGCEFDVPVRFGDEVDDTLQAAIENYNDGSISDIPLVEIRDELEMHNEFFFGGASYQALTADVAITLATGRALQYDSSTPNLKVKLPDPTNLPLGGPYWYIQAVGSEDVLLRDHDDTTTIATAASGGSMLVVLLAEDSGGAKQWWTV